VGSSPIVVVLFDFLSHFFKFILFILSCNQIFFCPTAVTYSGIQKYNTRLYIRQQYLAMSHSEFRMQDWCNSVCLPLPPFFLNNSSLEKEYFKFVAKQEVDLSEVNG
jgi:hypothetical protein